MGQSSSHKRIAIERANHLAIMKYLEKDLITKDEGRPPFNSEKLFVWSWIGIMVSILIKI